MTNERTMGYRSNHSPGSVLEGCIAQDRSTVCSIAGKLSLLIGSSVCLGGWMDAWISMDSSAKWSGANQSGALRLYWQSRQTTILDKQTNTGLVAIE